jgi:sugar lactone lactonase YvrE
MVPRPLFSAIAILGVLVCLGAASARADGSEQPQGPIPTSEEVEEAITEEESAADETPTTNPDAALGVSGRELGREEALGLLQGVFSAELRSPAGIFSELHIEKLLAPTVAVVASAEPPSGSLGATGEQTDDNREPGSSLLDATVPLRTEDPSGQMKPVDLELERSGDGLKPANPLVEVEIPSELGAGIEMPESGISIELAGVPEERTPSEVDGSLGFYPNVATDSDLAVAPTPTGVETLTQLRSPESPRSETLRLRLPQGDELNQMQGGAEVKSGDGNAILEIPPPTALDAAGVSVPVSLSVSGASMSLTVEPDESTKYPILVDPLFESFNWVGGANGVIGKTYASEADGWLGTEHLHGGTFDLARYATSREFEPGVPVGTSGLYADSRSFVETGGEAFWQYTVPRYRSDPAVDEGREPETYISRMTVSDMDWVAKSETLSPYVYMGLWSTEAGWVSVYSHEGLKGHTLSNLGWVYTFENPNHAPNVKLGRIGLYSTENTWPTETTGGRSWASLFVGAASIELAEPETSMPKFAEVEGPPGWVNVAPAPVRFNVADAGLGVAVVKVTSEQGSEPPTWKDNYGCTGVSGDACPFNWRASQSIEPAKLPQGVDTLKVVAEDPIGHVSTHTVEGQQVDAHVQVKVDHTAPELSLAGTLTEQATLGTKRPSYRLRWNATDGTAENPQSGVAKVRVKVDGSIAYEEAPGCATRDCSLASEWTLKSSLYSPGQHSVEVIAIDAVGLETKRSLEIVLDPSPPTLTLSGTMTEQANLGVMRPRYALKLHAAAEAGPELPAPLPLFGSAFGSQGSGNGQLREPGDVAVDAQDDLWVVDTINSRIEEFNEKGEYLSQFGEEGSGDGQLEYPRSLAIDPEGHIWVADMFNSRIEEFNEQGEYRSQFGSEGSAPGQFQYPDGIAIDPGGHIWVADSENSRLQEFDSEGNLIRIVGSEGSGPGQFDGPEGIAFDRAGHLWVTDSRNHRVEEFSPSGEFLSQFGEEGNGKGQFHEPWGITVDPEGTVWVSDPRRGRIEGFSQTGEYIGQLGSEGSGKGQFSNPMGIYADAAGRIWIADEANERVQQWRPPGQAPAYSMSFGRPGSGGGQLTNPAGMATDSEGHVWVTDSSDSRIEEFDAGGEFLRQIGSYGGGDGQFGYPCGVAVAGSGDIYVADTGNNRIQEFNPQGEFIREFGESGEGEGQLLGPNGVAVAPDGDVYVADTWNSRIEEFSGEGRFIRQFGSIGSEPGQLIFPFGVAVGPSGNVYVADSYNNRIDEFGPGGQFIRQFGEDELDVPLGLAVGPDGHVWVGDTAEQVVKEFSGGGEFLAQVGAPGQGQGKFIEPWGVATDDTGYVWVADSAMNRVQRWAAKPLESEISTEVTLDGKPVEAKRVGCISTSCPIAAEWELESSKYPAGKHTVVATAAAGVGNTTSRTLTIELQPDTTKPTLETGGELIDAPEGWVEQETYGLRATATDAGSGVTSLAFRIDGGTVAKEMQTCAEGGCEETLSKQVDMSPYSGGAHEAEIVATDAAGNSTTRRWTINVDPEGHISTGEAEATLEAVEETTEETPVAPADQLLEPEQIEHGDDPGLRQTGLEIESTGVPDTTKMTTDPEDGFTIESPEGTTEITPVVSPTSSGTTIAEGVAGVSADVGAEVDSVIRPEYNGVQTFQAIRSESSPTNYSWIVHLAEGQSLHAVNGEYAEVLYEDGTIAFLITAEEAHDATGAKVPTSIAVSGDVVTLNVEFHTKSFVYPIVAGASWETSYAVPVIVEGPEDETQIREREEREQRELEEREREEREVEENGSAPPPPPPPSQVTEKMARRYAEFGPERDPDVAPPPLPPPGAATASAVRYFQIYRSSCGHSCDWWKAKLYNATFIRHRESAEWEHGTQVHAHVDQSFAFEAVIFDTTWNCGAVGPVFVRKGSGEHLIAYAHFTIEVPWAAPAGETMAPFENNFALQDWIYPNGYQEKHVKPWDGEPVGGECPTVARP